MKVVKVTFYDGCRVAIKHESTLCVFRFGYIFSLFLSFIREREIKTQLTTNHLRYKSSKARHHQRTHFDWKKIIFHKFSSNYFMIYIRYL